MSPTDRCDEIIRLIDDTLDACGTPDRPVDARTIDERSPGVWTGRD